MWRLYQLIIAGVVLCGNVYFKITEHAYIAAGAAGLAAYAGTVWLMWLIDLLSRKRPLVTTAQQRRYNRGNTRIG